MSTSGTYYLESQNGRYLSDETYALFHSFDSFSYSMVRNEYAHCHSQSIPRTADALRGVVTSQRRCRRRPWFVDIRESSSFQLQGILLFVSQFS